MDHDHFVSVAARCWARKGAIDVVRGVHRCVLNDQRIPLPEEVLAALTQAEHLMKNVQRWKSAKDVYDGVQALLQPGGAFPTNLVARR